MQVLLTLLLGSLLVLLAPAYAHAVHECGSVHSDIHSDAAVSGGCDQLRESDFFYGDARADAPDLAHRGSHAVGVRTLTVVNPDQLDVLNYSKDNTNPRYNRPLTLETWYPAQLSQGERQLTTYRDVLGHGSGNPDRPNLPFEFGGRAARGARPDSAAGPFPLVIISHGYSGSRVIMTWLAENLASKGYVVVAIDHTESTHADAGPFHSTLWHRPRDINYALHSVSTRSAATGSFLSGLVDAGRTAVIGYSMGSYGVLSAAGVGASAEAGKLPGAVPGEYQRALQAGNPDYEAMLDSRIKVLVAFAPFAPPGFWSLQSLRGLSIPSLFIVGSQDQTTGFAAARWLFDNAVNSERYLLVFQGAIHEVATNPAPPLAHDHFRDYVHYQEPAWDNRRLNNINQHFVTAFLGTYLLEQPQRYRDYLQLPPISNDSPRTDTAAPGYWKGFANWTAIGMELHHATQNQGRSY